MKKSLLVLIGVLTVFISKAAGDTTRVEAESMALEL